MTGMIEKPLVIVVDDDPSVRSSLENLFDTVGLAVRSYATAAEFLASNRPDTPCCMVLDVRLPGASGLDFQAELTRRNVDIPIIFMTGHGDIPMSVKAMKAGAVQFLTKPFRDQDMLDAVQEGLTKDAKRRADTEATTNLKARFSSLSAREREVLRYVVQGLMNKQIAGALGVSEITVKVHRSNVMHKMGAKSLAELVQMAAALGVEAAGN